MDLTYQILLFLLLMVAFQYLAVARYFRNLRYGEGEIDPCEPGEVPEFLRTQIETSGRALEGLGFRYVTAGIRIDAATHSGIAGKTYFFRYLNDGSRTAALVFPPHSPVEIPYIAFETVFSDGHSLVTVNAIKHAILDAPPGVTFDDHYVSSIEEQLARHLERARTLAEQHGEPIEVPTEMFFSREKMAARKYIEHLQQSGWMAPDRSGKLRLSPLSALAFARIFLKGKKKRDRVYRDIVRHTNQQTETAENVEVEIMRFKETRALMKAGGMGTTGKLLMLLGSIMLFVLLSDHRLAWQDLIILTAIILVHEAGHILGMYIFNYRDLKILFIPFLGALAMGSKSSVAPYQQVVVLLLGPLPGLLLGLLLLYLNFDYQSDLVHSIAVMAVALNLFNLLPIMPLDGGQIVNVLFFSRFPLLETLFSACGAVGLAALAYYIESPILIVISIFMLMGLRDALLRARTLAAVRSEVRSDKTAASQEEDHLLRVIFRNISTHARSAAGQKYHLVNHLLQNSSARHAGLLQTFGLFLVYLAAIAAAPVGVVGGQALIMRRLNQELVKSCDAGGDRLLDLDSQILRATNYRFTPLADSLSTLELLADCHLRHGNNDEAIIALETARMKVIVHDRSNHARLKDYSSRLEELYSITLP